MPLITDKKGTRKTTPLKSIDSDNIFIIDDINRDVWINKGQRHYEFVESNFLGCVEGGKVITRKLGSIVFSNPEN